MKHYYDERDRSYFSIMLASQDDDCDYASFRISGLGHTFSWKLPTWVCPAYIHNYFNSHAQKYYLVPTQREFGFSKFEDCIMVRYGLQKDEWFADEIPAKRKFIYLNLYWKQWKFAYHRLFNLDGTVYAELKGGYKFKGEGYSDFEKAKETVPKIHFAFKDYDGERGIASCYLEEREWHKGEKYFSWLKYFFNPLIRRDLDISYNIEVGKKKGSWKGGIIGCGCDVDQNLSLEDNFKIHCLKEKLTYLGIAHED